MVELRNTRNVGDVSFRQGDVGLHHVLSGATQLLVVVEELLERRLVGGDVSHMFRVPLDQSECCGCDGASSGVADRDHRVGG